VEKVGVKCMTTEQLNIIVPALTTIAGATIGAAISYLVGRQQFKANVVSANRQAWINTLRDCIAEYQSAIEGIMIFLEAGRLKDAIEGNDYFERLDRLLFLQSKIQLLINSTEQDHQKLVAIVYKIRITTYELLQQKGKFQETMEAVQPLKDELTLVTQKILKREWERAKKGQ
jgi:hypothetical protein